MRIRLLTPLLAAALAAPAHAAAGDDQLTIDGAGYGHGIGMSQYGAFGYATHGFGYRDILRRYYSETDIKTVAPVPTVRVLLQSGSRVSFSGAVAGAGRKLSATRRYSAVASAGRVRLRNAAGKTVTVVDAPLRVSPGRGKTLRVFGTATSGQRDGVYRGALELRPSGRRLLAINAVGLEDYVRGVISAESPASWPAEALKAQAVAARTYAITTSKAASMGFDHYADTRSQMYKGVAAEFPSTDAAVAQTRHEVVTYGGRPVVTYFFSTSGGHTENVEFSFIGALPQPWLRGVEDPFDEASPKHRWTVKMSLARADRKLGSLVRGKLEDIEVVKRGVSPRVVTAKLVGSGGTTEVSGPTLRRVFGLNDTWAFFKTSSKP